MGLMQPKGPHQQHKISDVHFSANTSFKSSKYEVRLLLVLLAFPSLPAEICRIFIIPLCETAVTYRDLFRGAYQ